MHITVYSAFTCSGLQRFIVINITVMPLSDFGVLGNVQAFTAKFSRKS